MINPNDDPDTVSCGAYCYLKNLIRWELGLTEEEEAILHPSKDDKQKHTTFSNREINIIGLIKQGYDQATIAKELGVKSDSFRILCHRIYKKLNIGKAPHGDKFTTLRNYLIENNIE